MPQTSVSPFCQLWPSAAFFQAVLGYSPLTSGLLFLPFSAGVIISADHPDFRPAVRSDEELAQLENNMSRRN